MRFIDEVDIHIQSGKGGNGAISFRREKFVPFGGPDGGNGGKGGDIYFETTERLNTLATFRGKRRYLAQSGEGGMGSQRDGKSGEDLVISVPVGTQIFDKESNSLLADLTESGERWLAAKGGRGGLGNMFFKSSTNQAPKFAGDGEPEESFDLHLELKLLADIALVGLPNAGKSTLISRVSEAKPKIADYPFTTLIPNLGVVKGENQSLVIADIPGLIEDAHQGKGLGIQFLKHIERTSALVHLVDISWCLDPFEAYESYITIRQELEKYNPELLSKREVVCLTKIDAMTSEEVQKYREFFEEQLDKKVLPISSVSGDHIEELSQLLFKAIDREY